MSIRLQSYKVQNGLLGSILTSMGLAQQIGPAWGAVSASVVAGIDVCLGMLEDAAKGGVPPSPAKAWIAITKALGPYGGMSPNNFVVLASATAILAASGAALVIATGPVDIAIAAVCLFFDALAYAAADRDVRVSQHSEALRIGARRKLEMMMKADYVRQMGSRRPHAL